MANSDLLQTFLQLHLATDATAVANLPSVLSALSSNDLESSPHLAKWTNRINSLIHSRDSGARWAGITLALSTARLSRNVLLNSAQGWVSVVLPMLPRNESSLVRKACIKLLTFIFTSTTNLAQFQRHVVTPNVPKFSMALLSLAEKQPDEDLKVLCLDVLATIVSLYPSLHRQMSSALSTLSLNFLGGSHTFTPVGIIISASRLHACLHITGGKVGAAALWRKSVDETIAFCCDALAALRTTYAPQSHFVPSQADPLVSVPLNVDRLRCGVELLCHLLRAKVEKPVPVPIQPMVSLCVEALRVTREGPIRDDVDPSLRSIEATAVPSILELGCSLTSCLAKCVQSRLAPYLSRMLGVMVYHLEQPTLTKERLALLRLLPALLGSCLPPHEPLICGRMIKAILPSIATLLSEKVVEESTGSADVGSKKGKKRARGYEGDEVFKVGRSMLCETSEDSELVLAALYALPYLLRVPKIPAYLQSLSSRLLLSLLILLPKLPSISIANDPTIKDKVLSRVKSTCIEFACGSSTALCKNLPLIVQAVSEDDISSVSATIDSSNRNALLLDLMLHPRLPPLLRSLPPLDSVALWQSEEGSEERKTREALSLYIKGDTMMVDKQAREPAASGAIQQEKRVNTNQLLPSNEAEQPAPPIVIPAAPVRAAAPLVIQPVVTTEVVPLQNPHPDTESNVMQTDPVPQESPRLNSAPNPGLEEDRKIPLVQSVQPTATQNTEHQPPRHHEPSQMVVDDDDEDGDMEMPVIDPASPTESEVE